MVPRAYWKGYLQLSLVQCPIALYPATTERDKIRFHLINKRTGHRIRYLKVDAETGKPVDDDDIIKAYEISKGKYIETTDDELEPVALKSKHTIEIVEFVPKKEIDDLYHLRPYYIAPEGDAGAEAFVVNHADRPLEPRGAQAFRHRVAFAPDQKEAITLPGVEQRLVTAGECRPHALALSRLAPIGGGRNGSRDAW